MPRIRNLVPVLFAACLCITGSVFLAGCGGDGPPELDYTLTIDGPPDRSTSQSEVLLTGTAFLPPGSTCQGNCAGLMPPPVYGTLGPHSIEWYNEATGQGHAIALSWNCNCGGSAPSWMVVIPVAPGLNSITVTMTAAGQQQTAAVRVTRN
jgi:hypothetical protein